MSAKRRIAPRSQIRELARRSSVEQLAKRFARTTATVKRWISQGPPANVRDEVSEAFARSERARLAAEARADARAAEARREEERRQRRTQAAEKRRRERERLRAEQERREEERRQRRAKAAEARRRDREREKREEERAARKRSLRAKKAAATMRARREIVDAAKRLSMTAVHGIRDARWDREVRTTVGTDSKGRNMAIFGIRNRKTGEVKKTWMDLVSFNHYRSSAGTDASFDSIYEIETANYETVFDFEPDEEAA